MKLYTFLRYVRFMFLHLQKMPMKSVGHRPLLVKWGGALE